MQYDGTYAVCKRIARVRLTDEEQREIAHDESPMARSLRARQQRELNAVVKLQAHIRGFLCRRSSQRKRSTINSQSGSRWKFARAKLLQNSANREPDPWAQILRMSKTIKTTAIFSSQKKQYSYDDFQPKRFIAKGKSFFYVLGFSFSLRVM